MPAETRKPTPSAIPGTPNEQQRVAEVNSSIGLTASNGKKGNAQ